MLWHMRIHPRLHAKPYFKTPRQEGRVRFVDKPNPGPTVIALLALAIIDHILHLFIDPFLYAISGLGGVGLDRGWQGMRGV